MESFLKNAAFAEPRSAPARSQPESTSTAFRAGSQPVARGNRLIAALPPRDRARFLASAEQVELGFAEVLCEPGEPIGHAYFPNDGFISLLEPLDGRARLEIGLVGSEGMFGAALVLGAQVSAQQALVQGAGSATRITAGGLHDALRDSAALHEALKRYIYVQMCLFARTAVCTRFHLIEARLARWLLMTQDRVRSADFRMTHELLAHMLGVRRVGITVAAGALQRRGLIHYHHGGITVLDRYGLEAASCSCYRLDNEVYDRVIQSRCPYGPSIPAAHIDRRVSAIGPN